MSNQVPFTAFCPECNGHRTFTILGAPISHTWQPDTGAWVRDSNVGCCVCGTSERKALVAVSARVTDDAATIGEISARINTLDGEVTELRDEVHALTVARDGYRGERPCSDTGCTNLRVAGTAYCHAHNFSRRA